MINEIKAKKRFLTQNRQLLMFSDLKTTTKKEFCSIKLRQPISHWLAQYQCDIPQVLNQGHAWRVDYSKVTAVMQRCSHAVNIKIM